jgi:hypothetical protein
MEHMVGVTDRQEMLTPTSDFSRGPCLLTFLDLYLYGIYETDHCSLYYFFILMEKKMTVWCQRRRYT